MRECLRSATFPHLRSRPGASVHQSSVTARCSHSKASVTAQSAADGRGQESPAPAPAPTHSYLSPLLVQPVHFVPPLPTFPWIWSVVRKDTVLLQLHLGTPCPFIAMNGVNAKKKPTRNVSALYPFTAVGLSSLSEAWIIFLLTLSMAFSLFIMKRNTLAYCQHLSPLNVPVSLIFKLFVLFPF